MKTVLKNVIENAKGLTYQNTAMALDIICETLENKYDYPATFKGRSIYINDVRVASIKTCIENCSDAKIVGIYDYTIL